jgi:hypothetical protein
MSRNLRRGELVLEKLVAEHQLSSAGAKALVQAFDPFHDIAISDPQGWPDVESGASIVRCYKQSVTVAVPQTAAFPAGQNWDLHVVAWPFMLAAPTIPTAQRTNNIVAVAAVPQPGAVVSGGLTIYATAPGTQLTFSATTTTTVVLANVTLPSSVTEGAGRLTGYGFEVHNTTSALNIQGSVVVYRQQANSPILQSFFVQTPANVGTGMAAQNAVCDFSVVRCPPTTAADALLLNGSQQWDAKDGCYVVSNFMSAENPSYPIMNSSIIITGSENDDLEGTAVNTQALNIMQPTQQAAPLSSPWFPNLRVHPVHQSGAIFNGLSYTSTLTVNCNIYYESFPYTSDKDILVLAKPSTKCDQRALCYYSELCQRSPVGVPVKMNGLGDWFAQGIQTLASTIGPSLSAMPGLPGLIGKGLSMAAQTLPLFTKGPTSSTESGNNWGTQVTRKPKKVLPQLGWEEASGMPNLPAYTGPTRKQVKKARKKALKRAVAVSAQQPPRGPKAQRSVRR